MIKFFKNIKFSKMENGIEYYTYTYANNVEKECKYSLGDSYITKNEWGAKWVDIEISPQAMQKLLSCREEVKNELIDILQSGFFVAGGDYKIFYRRDRDDIFLFYIFVGNSTVYRYSCTIERLICNEFNFITLTDEFEERNDIIKTLKSIADKKFPLYQSAEKHDRRLYLTLKYMAGIASQEEADEATAIDGKIRFVPENKVYGEDVKVSNVKQIHLSFFNRSERYSCIVTIDSRKWNATWYHDSHELYIWQYFSEVQRIIKISKELENSIRKQAVKVYLNASG